ncbi:MAG: DUF4783 domain-containing protein [Cytophagales bacterium]|nr:DUF4783 domain-containing protein [Cytophagales bacterium]
MAKVFVFILIIIFAGQDPLDNLILSLEIKNGEEISKYFNSESEIIINNEIHKGNKYQQSKTLDNFYNDNNINKFNIIHKGDSENNIIYILAEYSSNSDLYKILLILKNKNNSYIIEKFKIDSTS